VRGAEADQFTGSLGSEQVGEDALTVVRVVYEKQQVTEADQGICAVAGRSQGVGPAMNVAYHVDPHPPTVGKSGKKAQPARAAGLPGERVTSPKIG
jgi:hypothetical protein